MTAFPYQWKCDFVDKTDLILNVKPKNKVISNNAMVKM